MVCRPVRIIDTHNHDAPAIHHQSDHDATGIVFSAINPGAVNAGAVNGPLYAVSAPGRDRALGQHGQHGQHNHPAG